ncbi:MAG: NADH-quinone oxidoreductase subunit NuoN [Pseudomonadota bacterium]
MPDLNSIFAALGSEVFLALAGLIGVFCCAVIGDRIGTLAYRLGALALFGAAIIAGINFEGGASFGGLVETTSFTSFAKIVAYVMGGIALLMAEGFMSRHGTLRYEYSLLMIFAALGMGVILSAADLMTLYMGIETLSLSSYVLAAFHRDNARSSEAGLKYFVLGALASGLLLYGASLVYGFTGSTRFEDIAVAVTGSPEATIGLLFGMVFMISGLAFKISAAPMHVWTPDVYEGAPSPVVTFFATAPKIASIVTFANVLYFAFSNAIDDWQMVVMLIAGASMLIGAFGALAQNNLKRLLAYSSIANMGYALVALAVGGQTGGSALLYFMLLYVIASLGLFAGVLAMRRRGGMVEDLRELSGLSKNHMGVALALTALVFSIAGIPPLIGFFGKWVVLDAALSANMIVLVVILIVSSVISLGYYLRLVTVMWSGTPTEPFEPIDRSVRLVLLVTALVSIFLAVKPEFVQLMTDQAASVLG